MISEELRKFLIKTKNEVINRDLVELIDDVLSSGEIDCKDKNGDTLLIWSIWYFTSTKLMELIIKNGANINHQGNDNTTPLIIATKSVNV